MTTYLQTCLTLKSKGWGSDEDGLFVVEIDWDRRRVRENDPGSRIVPNLPPLKLGLLLCMKRWVALGNALGTILGDCWNRKFIILDETRTLRVAFWHWYKLRSPFQSSGHERNSRTVHIVEILDKQRENVFLKCRGLCLCMKRTSESSTKVVWSTYSCRSRWASSSICG